MGINYLRTGPILTTPGGWGLRNPEPKGPGQRRIVFSQSSTAVAGRKLGGIMILANDPVTAFFNVHRPQRNPPHESRFGCPRGLLQRRPVGAIMSRLA